MKPVTLVGILLVILGALALAYQGIGGLVLVGGVGVLVMGARRKS